MGGVSIRSLHFFPSGKLKTTICQELTKSSRLPQKKDVVYVEKSVFSITIMLLSTMHQLQRSTCLNKK